MALDTIHQVDDSSECIYKEYHACLSAWHFFRLKEVYQSSAHLDSLFKSSYNLMHFVYCEIPTTTKNVKVKLNFFSKVYAQ